MAKKLIQRIHEIVTAYADTNEFMGTVLVAQNNETFLHQGYGKANIEWDIANNTKTKFRLGSL